MRLRDQTIGALNLFLAGTRPLSTHDLNVARVLADMAAIGIINHWSIRQQEVLAQQLQSALNTRVIIEQAKGALAERQGLTMGEAFESLRSTARASQRPIAEIAADTIQHRGLPQGYAAADPASTPPATANQHQEPSSLAKNPHETQTPTNNRP